MATNTYVALRKETVTGSAVASVTLSLSGITGYTDLIIVTDGTGSADSSYKLQFNGDTNTNYSETYLYGNGTSSVSGRDANLTAIPGMGRAGTTRGNGIIQIMNYSNSTTYKTVIGRGNLSSQLAIATVGLWRSSSAITSVTIIPENGNIAVGSTFSVYGIAAQPVPTAKATGGTIVYAADGYTYHTFTSSGTFTPSVGLTCDVLTIAGGGGSGANHGGGGGGGGLLYTSSSAFSATGYAVTVGAGGTGSPYPSGGTGTNGVNSSVNSLVAIGGGRGGDFSNSYEALDGGSGGGAQASGTSYVGLGTSGQGFNGGGKNPNYALVGGGGGGAGAVGQTQTLALCANGGVGLATYSQWGAATSTGQNVNGVYYYAGGGGGGGWNGSIPVGTIGYGGYGGGGNSGATTGGGVSNGTAGTANTGGGGGCGGGGSSTGSAGGSGLVIIRYVSA